MSPTGADLSSECFAESHLPVLFDFNLVHCIRSVNDKSTIRFFYNMGIEFVQNLQATYGVNQLRSIFEGDNSCIDTSSVDYDNNAAQLSNDFQQASVEANEPEVSYTPHKERVLSTNDVISVVDVFI